MEASLRRGVEEAVEVAASARLRVAAVQLTVLFDEEGTLAIGRRTDEIAVLGPGIDLAVDWA